MNVISMIGQKGGAGKSTMARVLLSAMVDDGKNVLLLDCDPNRSTIAFANALAENDPDSAAYVTAYACPTIEDLEKQVHDAEASGKFDFCIIDTKGEYEEWVDDVIGLSDRVIIPLKISHTDFHVQMVTYQRYMALKNVIEDPEDLPPLFFVFNQIKPGARYPKDLAEQFQEMAEHPAMCRYYLSEKNVYNSTDRGILIGEMLKRLKSNKQPTRYVVDALDEAKALLDGVMNADVGSSGETN